MYLSAGTLLREGTYKIIRLISSGGFGITYEAEHVMLQKRVAIKEFFVKDFCNRNKTTSRVTVGTQSKVALVNKLRHKFMEEAKTLSTFHHPNIVHVSDVFEENGTAYYVMDYIEGHSLAEIVNAKGKLTETKALKYIRQVADALKYVHAHHRLHLDIKPGNIMIDKTDKAILIDFGASKQYDEANGENTSTLMGITTPGYAPIEQTARTFTTFSAPTDIYALGATLYKLVTGITPPDSSLIVSEGLPPLPTSISAPTRNAIEQAMKVRKQDRVQTVEAFLSILNEDTLVDHEIAHKSNSAESNPSLTSNSKMSKNNNSGMYIVLIGIAVLIGIIYLLINNNSNPSNIYPSQPSADTIQYVDTPHQNTSTKVENPEPVLDEGYQGANVGGLTSAFLSQSQDGTYGVPFDLFTTNKQLSGMNESDEYSEYGSICRYYVGKVNSGGNFLSNTTSKNVNIYFVGPSAGATIMILNVGEINDNYLDKYTSSIRKEVSGKLICQNDGTWHSNYLYRVSNGYVLVHYETGASNMWMTIYVSGDKSTLTSIMNNN